MKYYKEIKDENGVIYSCDMIRINFTYWEDIDAKRIQKYFGNISRTDVEDLPMMTIPLKFRFMYKINHDKSCMVVGFHFNALQKDGKRKGYIEFNPNKCLDKRCLDDLEFLRGLSKSFSVARWDLAIDLPCKRTDCVMMKDGRMYQLVMHSLEDRTEYLGCRSQQGYVKLYNKTMESNLDYDLTRLEITLAGLENIEEQLNSYVPQVFIRSQDFEKKYAELTPNTQVIVDLIRKSDDMNLYLNKLDKRMKQKIKPYILQEDTEFYHSTNIVENIVTEIKEIVKEKKIDKTVISSDVAAPAILPPIKQTIINGEDITQILIDSRRSNAIGRLKEAQAGYEKANSDSVKQIFAERIKTIREEYKDVFEKEYIV